MQELYSQAQTGAATRSQEVNKVLRNTYSLLAMTLAFSSIMAVVSMAVFPAGTGFVPSLVCSFAALALIWFVLPRTANSAAGIWVVFAFTGLLGFGLGPIISSYVAMNGGAIVAQALGGTALVFFALSGYALITGKDFSFMSGFIVVGLVSVIAVAIGSFVMSLFGVDTSIVQLAISAAILLLMSAIILFQTSQIINGGETNYIMATAQLYLAIYNIFTSLLHLLGAMDD